MVKPVFVIIKTFFQTLALVILYYCSKGESDEGTTYLKKTSKEPSNFSFLSIIAVVRFVLKCVCSFALLVRVCMNV